MKTIGDARYSVLKHYIFNEKQKESVLNKVIRGEAFQILFGSSPNQKAGGWSGPKAWQHLLAQMSGHQGLVFDLKPQRIVKQEKELAKQAEKEAEGPRDFKAAFQYIKDAVRDGPLKTIDANEQLCWILEEIGTKDSPLYNFCPTNYQVT